MNLSFILFVMMVSQSTGQVYDPFTETVCGGIVQNISHDVSFMLECCGTSLYNISTSRCCDGKVLEMPIYLTDLKNTNCCGETWYNYHNFSCCKDKLYSRSEKVCNDVEGTLFDIADNKDLGFCHGIVYNTSYQQCSYNNFYMESKDTDILICNRDDTKDFAPSCCGNTTYDPEEELCCIDTVHPLYTYDVTRARNQCCGSNVYELQSNDHMALYTAKFTCCGDVVTEKSSVTEECCGSIRYNTTDSLCCEGVLLENVPFGHKCCGTTSYNTQSSLCCNGEVYPLSFSLQGCHYNMENPMDRKNYHSERIGNRLSDRYRFGSPYIRY